MLVYYVVILFVFVLCSLAEKTDYIRDPYQIESIHDIQHSNQTKHLFILSVIILILVSGLRYHVGTDSWQYERNITYYANNISESLSLWGEPGVRILAKLSILINSSDPEAVFFLITSGIICGLFLKTVYKSTFFLMMSSLLFIFLSWTDSFNGIRQFLAAAILFSGLEYIIDRKPFKWILIVLVATLFHKTAIVMVFIYFIANNKNNVRNMILMIIGVIAAGIFYSQLVSVVGSFMGETMTGNYSTLAVNILRVLVSVSPALLFWPINVNKELDDESRCFLNLILVHAALSVVASSSAYLTRIKIYTTPFVILGIPKLLQTISPKNRKVIQWIILILYFAFWWYDTYKSSNLNTFHWIWNR